MEERKELSPREPEFNDYEREQMEALELEVEYTNSRRRKNIYRNKVEPERLCDATYEELLAIYNSREEREEVERKKLEEKYAGEVQIYAYKLYGSYTTYCYKTFSYIGAVKEHISDCINCKKKLHEEIKQQLLKAESAYAVTYEQLILCLRSDSELESKYRNKFPCLFSKNGTPEECMIELMGEYSIKGYDDKIQKLLNGAHVKATHNPDDNEVYDFVYFKNQLFRKFPELITHNETAKRLIGMERLIVTFADKLEILTEIVSKYESVKK